MVDLINSKVYLTHPEILPFLYPKFRYMEKIVSLPNLEGIIFPVSFGMRIEEVEIMLAQCSPKYIILCKQRIAQVEQEFVEPEDYVNLISDVAGLRYAKDISVKCKRLDKEELLGFYKMSIVLKRWYREAFHRHEQMYQLFDDLTAPRMEFLKTYFILMQTNSPEHILSSVLTFLERTVRYGDQRDNLSSYYKKMVKRGKHKFQFFREALLALLDTPDTIPGSIKNLSFYMALRERL